MASFPFFFLFSCLFLASSSWQTLDPKSPSVPSITLHLTNMHMYIARVSTEPGGSEGTFPPSPCRVSGPWFALHASSLVPRPAWSRQQGQAVPRGLGMASLSSRKCSKGPTPGKQLTSTAGLDCWPNHSTVCPGRDVGSCYLAGMLRGWQMQPDLCFALEIEFALETL